MSKIIPYRILGIIFAMMLGVLTSGCVVTKVHTMPVETYSAPYDEVWDSLIVYLNNEKDPIVVADKEKGIIYTDWVNEQKVFVTKRYRYNIQIEDIGENKIQVGIVTPEEVYSMGDWEELLPHERKAKRIFEYIENIIRTKGTSKKVSSRPFNRRVTGISR